VFVMFIEQYQFGSITIEGLTYTKDVIILPERILSEWRRLQGHELAVEDLEAVLSRKPSILVVGTGKTGMMNVGPDVARHLESKGIKVLCSKTDEAVKKFNEYCESNKDVAAALHLTC